MSVLPPPETQLRSEDGWKLLKYLFITLSRMWQSGDTMMYGRSVCGHRRLMDTSRNLHDPTIHSARRWQGWNVSCVNVANNDITIKQNAIMSCSYYYLHEPVSITVTCDMGWGDPGCLTMRTRTNWAVTIHAFTFSYKLQLTSPPSTRQSPPSRTPHSGQRSQLWNEKTI